MSESAPHPKRWKWRAEWMLQVALENVLGCLPLTWVFHLGRALGGLAWHLMPSRRAVVLRNLRIALAGHASPAELEEIARESFRRTGANMFSAARTARLSPAKLHRIFTIENPQVLSETLAEGRGLVLLLAHMGNWELLSRLIYFFPPGSKTGAFYRPLNNPLLDRRVLNRREADGTRMFSKRDNPLQVAHFLREGGTVGILADQRVGPQGELVNFFGRRTRGSPLPSLLARRSKAALLALALSTDSPGRWRVRFIRVDGTTTRHCMAAVEAVMRSSLTDVFWFQDRWKAYVNEYTSATDWLGDGTSEAHKPHRALLWLPGTPANWEPPASWWHPDVVYEAVVAADGAAPPWLPPGTRLHPPPATAGREDIRQTLTAIDAAAALPIDFVLTTQASRQLAKACRRAGLPLATTREG